MMNYELSMKVHNQLNAALNPIKFSFRLFGRYLTS